MKWSNRVKNFSKANFKNLGQLLCFFYNPPLFLASMSRLSTFFVNKFMSFILLYI